MLSVDKEETDERFVEMDSNRDGFITWEEYIGDAYGDLSGSYAVFL